MADPTAAVALNALASDAGANVVTEKHLTEFLSQVQASALANGTAAQYSNPAALSGEMFRGMRGYLRQTSQVQGMFNRKDIRVDNSEMSQAASSASSNVQGADLHGGPAKEQLVAAGGKSDGGVTKSTLTSIEDLGKLADRYAEVMQFGAITSVVTGGASIAGHAVTSLTKGQ